MFVAILVAALQKSLAASAPVPPNLLRPAVSIGRLPPNFIFESAPGLELTAASLHDMNDDGIQEVLLRFSPPMRQEQSHLLLLSYSRRDRHYVKVWELAGFDIQARWVLLEHTKGGPDIWGLEVEAKDQSGALSKHRYRYYAERVHESR